MDFYDFVKLILIIGFIIGFTMFLKKGTENMEKNNYINAIGDTVVIDNDTTTIINANYHKNEYELGNGQTISFNYHKRCNN